MRHFMTRAGVLAAMASLAIVGFARQYAQAAPAQQAAPAKPAIIKQEQQAYSKLEAEQSGDPAKFSADIDEFAAKYPSSMFIGGLYSQLATIYFGAGQMDKMEEAANKTLQINPDSADVLPMLAMVTARSVNSKTADVPGELKKAQDYGTRGLAALTALDKPAGMDDATFTNAKNQKMSMCHSALGLVDVDLNKNDDAVTELKQAVALVPTPDPVDLYLLGHADVATSHFTAAIDNFTKCAAGGPLQAQCKAGIDDAKKKKETGLEAPE
jgi:tetratricopeptide (TPR) repeat protein